MTIKELLKLSPEQRQKLNAKQLREAVDFTAKVAKARRTRIQTFLKETAAPKSTAYHDWSKAAQKRIGIKNYFEANFDAKPNATVNQLRHQLKINLTYLRAKTSTITGTKNELLKFYRRVSGKKKASWEDFTSSAGGNKDMFEKYWRLYERLKQDDWATGQLRAIGFVSEQIQEFLWEEMVNSPYSDIDEIYENILKKIDDMYNNRKAANKKANDSVDESTRFTMG